MGAREKSIIRSPNDRARILETRPPRRHPTIPSTRRRRPTIELLPTGQETDLIKRSRRRARAARAATTRARRGAGPGPAVRGAARYPVSTPVLHHLHPVRLEQPCSNFFFPWTTIQRHRNNFWAMGWKNHYLCLYFYYFIIFIVFIFNKIGTEGKRKNSVLDYFQHLENGENHE